MRTIILKLTCTIFAILTLVLLAPSFAGAEENDTYLPLNVEVNVLDNNSEKAEILDVNVNNLLGIDSINVEIPNEKNKQNSNGNNEEAIADVSVNDKGIGDIKARVLSRKETALLNEEAVVDIAASDLLTVDEMDLAVLRQEVTSEENAFSREEAVVDIAIQGMTVVDEVDVGVLKQEQASTESATSSEKAVADIRVDDLIIADQAELDVLSESNLTIKDEIHQGTLEVQQGVHLKTSDLPILENLHVGVLENQYVETTNGYYENSKILTVSLGDDGSPTLKNITLGDLELNVLEFKNMKNDSSELESSSLVGIELVDSFLGDLSTFVLLSESAKDEEFQATNSGVVKLVGNELPVLDGIHLSVLDQHQKLNGESKTFSEGVVQLDILSDVLDELSVDVLTTEGYTNSEGTSQIDHLITIGLTNDVIGNTVIDILPRENYVAGQTVIKPTNPSEESEDNYDENIGGSIGGTTDTDGDREEVNGDGSPGKTTDTSEDADEVNNDTANETTDGSLKGHNTVGNENTDREENETSIVGFSSNSNGVKGNSSSSNSEFYVGSSLPKTGGLFTSVMLIIMAICLVGSGVTIRKFA
ncbi:hypothetical protein PB01_02585 [Psychrobacillus glaciei]|uniref:LPXTG cell wall anchor domain-containing protein n=1 Tax=Psychrobacillus glaciei TaxID=2283160 RepID=A0A5J6SIX1_9BACI|nr:hypothetical protein [Psychrobacillus glaciei]QFF97788.1 hypothetical protein PB01_02585 [Psychrobacillus glaciei]